MMMRMVYLTLHTLHIYRYLPLCVCVFFSLRFVLFLFLFRYSVFSTFRYFGCLLCAFISNGLRMCVDARASDREKRE